VPGGDDGNLIMEMILEMSALSPEFASASGLSPSALCSLAALARIIVA
jgi:hypothetical protein